MLGSVSEAEDVVQDAFLRHELALADGVEVASPKAYLSAVVTRRAIDQLRSARVRRESYSGQWLPEPLLTDEGAGDPAAQAEQVDTLSMAFLLLLERLSPVERAVFLLHDVFGYGYGEVAEVVGKTEANCRQLASRARRRVEEGRPRFEATREARDALARRFFAAVADGDLDGLVALLADDVVVYGDGGGKVPQWSTPITGVDRVGRLLAGLGRKLPPYGARIEVREVNGQPGVVVRDRDGRVINVFAVDVAGGRVHAVRSVINPDKLRHLGEVADVWALLRERER
ncbi:MAG: RNA polymerase sigma-70 factor [Solirubrobacterales bacterium]|nr:RNA polymerase sigma-70 factor [Solirubrobacterales bacterium]